MAGGRAFIRDARVDSRQLVVVASDSNVGFLPDLSASAESHLAPRWRALLDHDGLVRTQGRAIGPADKIRYELTEPSS